MPTSANAKLQYEASQTAVAMSALTDAGDHLTYAGSGALWSRRSGYAPVVRPDGVITGGVVTAAVSGSNDVVDVSALTAYVNGSAESNAAETDVSITRPATAVAKINSITYDKSSGAVVVVAGTDGATTSFSETRGAAGGPPFIPADAIELAQVRIASDTAAAIASAEIFSQIGNHRETYNYPSYRIDYRTGQVTFKAALPASHASSVTKTVYASYAIASFSDIDKVSDFVPAEKSYSINSTTIYGDTIGASTSSLAQASFNAYLDDGTTDGLVDLEGQNLWFKFFQDADKSPYILTQGILGFTRSFAADDQVQAACTISAETASVEVSA